MESPSLERAQLGETFGDGTRPGAVAAPAFVEHVGEVGLGAGPVEAGAEDVSAALDDPAGDHRRDPGDGDGSVVVGMVIAISPTPASTSIRSLRRRTRSAFEPTLS